MAFKTEADSEVVERDEWSYSPAVGVGPLRFGMTVDEVVGGRVASREVVYGFHPIRGFRPGSGCRSRT
ncbi:hypothetical protein ACWCXH_38965 [Kitasatospora sp. NPDC001660]